MSTDEISQANQQHHGADRQEEAKRCGIGETHDKWSCCCANYQARNDADGGQQRGEGALTPTTPQGECHNEDDDGIDDQAGAQQLFGVLRFRKSIILTAKFLDRFDFRPPEPVSLTHTLIVARC